MAIFVIFIPNSSSIFRSVSSSVFWCGVSGNRVRGSR